MTGLNGTRQIIDIGGNGGGFTNILATGPTRRLIIRESTLTKAGVANVPQGLQWKDITDGLVQVYALPAAVPASQPGAFPQITLPDLGDQSFVGDKGLPIGNGPSVNIGVGVGAATTLVQIKSLTATPTSIEVIQIY
jgi:hypothetical protein